MKKAGRPSEYTDVIADRICAEIASGRAVHQFAGKNGFPVQDTIYRWNRDNKGFAEKYARAREDQADLYAAQIVELADKCRPGKKTRETKDGTFVEIGDMVERSRLQIDARKWYASKLAPKKYGDKIEQNVTGELTVKRVMSDI
jgi:hypothetical protein